MKKIIFLAFLASILSGCSYLRVHKMDVEQGNVITQEQVSQLKLGMTESQVIAIMGNPLLTNLFEDNRLDYIYTYQPGYGKRTEQRVSCLFQGGRLRNIVKT